MTARHTSASHRAIRRARRLLAVESLETRLLLSVVIAVDATAQRHPIDPNIYGTAWADRATLADLNAPLDRAGGNTTSTYNWQQNASNHASDWYFESISDTGTAPGALGDSFVADARAASAQADLTIPTLGWVAKLGPNRGNLASFSVAKYGPQQSTDPWMPDAGNGVHTNGQDVTGNDPNDANVPADAAFQQGWIQHLLGQWGNAAAGGVRYYTLDNEPSIWFSTHRDVHPTGPTMDEVRDKIISYGSMIKSLDPGAQVLGPEEWGWSGYFYSGYDQQYGAQNGWSSFPDRAAHGNMDYLPWLLDQLHQHDMATGQRLLDDFTVHYYPQGGEFSDDVSTAMQLLRNRSTRSLWDPSYVDQSWINDKVDLIPRLQGWVNTYYPGTKVGLTEYNWGAEGHMNGATTQADILGIFGRQGLDLANRWTTPAAGSPTYLAMKLYRNYDGQDSTFGDTSVAASVPNPDQVSAFAATRSADGTLTITVVNKNLFDPSNPSATTSITLNLSDFAPNGSAQEWQLAAVNPTNQTQAAITHLPDVAFGGSSFTVAVPMQSMTLFILHPAQVTAPAAPAGLVAVAGDTQVSLGWSASTGAATYDVYRGMAPGGEGGVPYRTGLTSPSFVDTAVSDGVPYYYQVTAVNAAGESGRSAEVSARPMAVIPSGIAIDAGGGAVGGFGSDTGFSGGRTASITHAVTITGVATPAAQAVYRTWRYGSFTYMAGNLVPGASYTVRLHFADNTATATGQHVFNVVLNGQTVLRNFDVFAAAGGRYRALAREFTATADSTGSIALRFQTVTGQALVNGLEFWQRPLLAVDAGGGAAGAYAADGSFSGGTTATTTAAIDTGTLTDPAAQAVYQSERYGNFTYTLANLTPGRLYVVRLDFAEIYWNASGQRLFDVKINGAPVLTHFDVFATAGGKNRAVRRAFLATADASGRLTLEFDSVVNFAKVSGIAVF
jgi:hypothetical protein